MVKQNFIDVFVFAFVAFVLLALCADANAQGEPGRIDVYAGNSSKATLLAPLPCAWNS